MVSGIIRLCFIYCSIVNFFFGSSSVLFISFVLQEKRFMVLVRITVIKALFSCLVEL